MSWTMNLSLSNYPKYHMKKDIWLAEGAAAALPVASNANSMGISVMTAVNSDSARL